MATPNYKFGIFFPEHTGYLYVRKLAPGNEGGVALVRSVADGMQCVRKKTNPDDRQDPESKVAEDYKVLNIDHEDHHTLKSTVMISKYCNGGTLNSFGMYFIRRRDSPDLLPEVVLWRMLNQRLQTLLYLHHSQQGITSLDNHLQNVFLHYEEGAKLPDFYTGDLGHAMPIDPAIWEETTADASINSPGFQKIKEFELRGTPYIDTLTSMSNDLTNIWYGLIMLMYLLDLEEEDPTDQPVRAKSRKRQQWSPELFECESKLEDIAGFAYSRGGTTTAYNELEALSIEISRMAELSAAANPDADVRFALRNLDTYSYEDDLEILDGQLLQDYRTAHSELGLPATFDSRIPLLQMAEAWPEPWRIARIEEGTGRVLGVEKMTYTFNLPKLKDEHGMDDDRIQYLARPQSSMIGLQRILAAAEVADTVTHLIGEDYALVTFVRGDRDDPNEDEIFGLDPEWTDERLAGPVNVKEETPSFVQESRSQPQGNSLGNPIVIDDSSDDDLMEIDGKVD